MYNGGCLTCTDLSKNENIIRVLSVEFKPLDPPPAILYISTTSIDQTSVSFNVALSASGKVYCGVFYANTTISSSDVIRLQNNVRSNNASMTIGSLDPATAYDIVCTTEGLNGMKLGLSDSLQAKKVFSTKCCKVVSAATTTSTINLVDETGAPAGGISNAIIVNLDALPAKVLGVRVEVYLAIQNPSTSTASRALSTSGNFALVPAKTSFERKGGSSTIYLSITKEIILAAYNAYVVNDALDVNMMFSITLTGNSSEYNVTYPSPVKVLDPSQDPAAPKPVSVYFSNDGSGLIITFDSKTDQGQITSSYFSCDKLLNFKNMIGTSCSWQTPSIINVRLGTSATVNINDGVALLNGTIKAQCTKSSERCRTFNSTDKTVLKILKPLTPLVPLVKILAPSIVNRCDKIEFDLSASRGSGGRNWKSVDFNVVNNNGTKPLVEVSGNLTAKYDNSRPSSITPDTLKVGSYSFQITICNFLDSCSTESHTMRVIDKRLPLVSIFGESLRSVYTKSGLTLVADASVTTCDKGVFNTTQSTLDFFWRLYDGQILQLVESTSKLRNAFKLNPYTLKPGVLYTVELNVIDRTTFAGSTALARVYVQVSNIIAIIKGSGSR